MASVYILYSATEDIFYVGSTEKTISQRLTEHLEHIFPGSFTMRADDWEIYLKISCESIVQARAIELHIKRMKSRKYIQNLLLYPELIEKLKSLYSRQEDI
jgi:putative endonuclease